MGGALAPSSLESTIMHSVVIIKEATLEESIKDLLTTLAGSIIPASIILTYSSMAALYPISSFSDSNNFPTTTAPSFPAFSAMVLQGILMAFLTMSIPTY